MGGCVTLTRDYYVKDALYAEDDGFYPKGMVGMLIDLIDIKHLTGITPESHERLVAREVMAKDRCHFLVSVGWKIVSLPVSICKMECEKY